jgi:hypothetical protein
MSGVRFGVALTALVLLASADQPAHCQTAVQTWVQHCKNSIASFIAVDGSGNVVVAGRSIGGISTSADFVTIKYTGAGVPLWTNFYNGPDNGGDFVRAMAVDRNGNVFVTGASWTGGAEDFATIKYSAAGAPLWTRRYSGGNGHDSPASLAVDGSGNVIVTGSSADGLGSLTSKYSGLGAVLWSIRSDNSPRDVAIDRNDNVIITGYSGAGGDFLTIKYSAAGVPLWTNRYNGPANETDAATAIVVDANADVIVTGSSYGNDRSNPIDARYDDYATIKYSAAGVPLWTNRYNGPANDYDRPWAMAVDGSGNVFVTGDSGITDHTSVSYDFATVAYSAGGTPLWTNRYSATPDSHDRARAIAVDGGGNVFVGGSSPGSNGFDDYTIIKYSGAGIPLWTNRYNGAGNRHDGIGAIAVDTSGTLFATGTSSDGTNYQDITYYSTTIKYVDVWPVILNQSRFTDHVFSFSFTNTPGASFTPLSATNLGLPANEWTSSGGITEIVPGQFKFTNSPATSSPQRFYRISSP